MSQAPEQDRGSVDIGSLPPFTVNPHPSHLHPSHSHTLSSTFSKASSVSAEFSAELIARVKKIVTAWSSGDTPPQVLQNWEICEPHTHTHTHMCRESERGREGGRDREGERDISSINLLSCLLHTGYGKVPAASRDCWSQCAGQCWLDPSA